MAKWQNIGSVLKSKDGRKNLRLNADFLKNPKKILEKAYTDKNGHKHFSIFDPKDGAPDFVIGEISVKIED